MGIHNRYVYTVVKNDYKSHSFSGLGKTLLLPALLTLFLVAALVLLFAVIMSWTFKLDSTSPEQNYPLLLSLMLSVFEGTVALVSVWLLIHQLKDQTEAENKENAVKVAEFIFNYNQEFIDSPGLAQIESFLESTLLSLRTPNISSLDQTPEIRQQLVNYLAYLEGFSSCVHSKVMELSSVDRLFSYRFFIAANHPEVQKLELLPDDFAPYYLGIYYLYREWVKYRVFCSPDWEEKLSISQACVKIWDLRKTNAVLLHNETSLDFTEKYEERAQTIKRGEQSAGNRIEAVSYKNGDIFGVLEVQGKKSNICITICRKLCCSPYECFETLVFLLKEYVKLKPTADEIKNLCLSGSDRGIKNMEILTDEEITTTAREILQTMPTKADLKVQIVYRQLMPSDILSKLQKEEIAGLIYDTDPYIYPAMFESREDAIAVLSELIGRDPLYKNERFFVAQKGEHIIGIVLWVDQSEYWSPEMLKEAADKLGVSLPETLSLAVDGYFNKEDDKERNKGIIGIDNLCIDSAYRGRHIGEKLLKSFIELHLEQNLRLGVLRDNLAAVKLYTGIGFVANKVYDGFSVEAPKPKCIEMIRLGNCYTE